MKAQVLLIIIFTLTFALFSVFMLLAPIKDKLLRIKDMENVYQAISNSEKGLEASLLDVFKRINLYLNKSQNIFQDTDCGGLNLNLIQGLCTQITYTPEGNPWRSDERFKDDTFIFLGVINEERVSLLESISNGFSGKEGRTTIIGPKR
jgi:hypothetical protein